METIERAVSGITDRDVMGAMEMKGGLFASRLAVAAMYADEESLALIKAAFPSLWAAYRRIAEADLAERASA